MSVIHFFYQKQFYNFRNRGKLKQFLLETASVYKIGIDEMNIVFCSDAYMLGINKKHLRHNYYTDIITFDLSEEEGRIRTEIYISIDRVEENAKILKIPFSRELHRVIFHGLLHLIGYNDKSSSEKQKMRTLEDELLSNYFDK